ncbi:MAG: hypothetical protein IKU43_00950 [Clostridia bacterium]|nr:hypothetical protein [Clostridia bacterium]
MENKREIHRREEIKNVHPTSLRRSGSKSVASDNIRIKDVHTFKPSPSTENRADSIPSSEARLDTGTTRPRTDSNTQRSIPVKKTQNTSPAKPAPTPSPKKAKITPEREAEIYTRNLVNLILCGVFALMVITMSLVVIIHMMLPNKATYSEFEKRSLEQAPRLTLSTLFDGTFSEGFDRFFSDNFPMRETLVEGATALKRFRGVRAFKADASQVIGGDNDIYSEGDMEISVDENKFSNAEEIVIADSPVQDAPLTAPTTDEETLVPEVVQQTPAVEAVPEVGTTAEPAKTEPQGQMKGEKRDTLYLIGDTAYEYFRGSTKSSTDYINVLNTYAKYIPSEVKIFNIVIPTHPEFGLEGADRTVSNDQKPVIDYIGSNLDRRITFVNPYNRLQKAYKNGEYIYFRTDHHWTIRGAYRAYEEFCESAGFTAVPVDSYETGRIEPFLGTFYSGSNRDKSLGANPDYVEYFKITTPNNTTKYDAKGVASRCKLYYTSVSGEANGYLAFMGGDHPYVNIKTDNENGRVLMIFKESFGNPLIGLLAQHYSEIHVADIRYFPYNPINFINQYGVTDVLFCNGIMSANSKARVNDLMGLMNK